MMGVKLITSFVGLLFLITSFHETQSFNPLATDKVLGYFGSLDTKFKAVDFWKKILVGSLDSDVSNSEILDELKLVTTQVKELGINLEKKIDKTMILTANRIRAFHKVDAGIRDLIAKMDNVDYVYDEYFSRIANKMYDNSFLLEYVRKILKGEVGPKFEVYKMNRLFYPNRTEGIDEGLFVHIQNQIEMVDRERCDESFSPQVWLFNIYINVMITEIKAYLMTTLAYTIDTEMNNENHNISISIYTEELGQRISKHLSSFRKHMSKAPRHIRRCDPEHYVRGENFFELERLIQLYLLREDELPNRDTCVSCKHIPLTYGANLKVLVDADLYISRPCNGTISRCGGYIRSALLDGEVCLLPPDNNKRYEWISTGVGSYYEYFGNNDVCHGKVTRYTRQEYPRWWSHNPEICQYCACLCAEHEFTRTVRSFSLRPQLSTFRANMVIVGVRLVEIKKIVHIQIKEGRLLPGGRVNPSSEVWVTLEKMDPVAQTVEIISHNSRDTVKLTVGEHFTTLNLHDNKLLLEDVMAPKGSTIIGVRFANLNAEKSNFAGLGLEIMTVPFNWTTGELIGEGKWQININDRKVFTEYLQNRNVKRPYNLDIPTKSKPNLPTWENTIIEFDVSNPRVDAGQTVVPFFDSIPVQGNPSVPLGGIGLIYKTSPGYGGFITPRIHNIDFSDYLDPNILNGYH